MKMESYRNDFTFLKSNNIYLDSSCMSLRPKQVIDAMNAYYNEYPACAGRSVHHLATTVTQKVEDARKKIKKFFGAKKHELIFTKNTTEALNIVAHGITWKKGDEIIITDKEHNSNLIPWLRLKDVGVSVHIVHEQEDGTFDMDAFKSMLSNKTKLVSVCGTSNITGYTTPISDIGKLAHKHGALLCVDGAQMAPHHAVDLSYVDFFAFSGHKMCGPSGIGGLLISDLSLLTPMIVGGETVVDSTYDHFEFEQGVERFEGGLQDYAGIIGLAAACDYLSSIGLKHIAKHEVMLNTYLVKELSGLVDILGPEDVSLRGGVFNFIPKGCTSSQKLHEIAMLLDQVYNIQVRSGAHCVHSWYHAKKLPGSIRASLYFYNTMEECEQFVSALKDILAM